MGTEIRRGTADANGIRLAYEDIGDRADPPVVLIMGFSAQLTMWPMAFCERIVDAGYRVIRFDNRDIGLSTKLDGARVEGNRLLTMARAWLGQPSPMPYTMYDLTDDTVGLLDHLEIESAHIVGASMGGIVAQLLAGQHPKRVRTLGILFSTTLQPFLPPPHPTLLAALTGGPGKGASLDERRAFSMRFSRLLNGRGYPMSEAEIEEAVRNQFDRDTNAAGLVRQLFGTFGTGSVLGHTKRITAPTVVVHGTDDRLVPVGCGKAVAQAIPRARLHVVDGMGHNIPAALAEELADTFLVNTGRATPRPERASTATGDAPRSPE